MTQTQDDVSAKRRPLWHRAVPAVNIAEHNVGACSAAQVSHMEAATLRTLGYSDFALTGPVTR